MPPATGTNAATPLEGSKKCCVAEASPLLGYHSASFDDKSYFFALRFPLNLSFADMP